MWVCQALSSGQPCPSEVVLSRKSRGLLRVVRAGPAGHVECRHPAEGREPRTNRSRLMSSSRRRPGPMAEGRNNTSRLAGVTGTQCRDEPSAVAVPLLCRCCAVNETPSLVPQNRLHSFGPRSPIAHRLLQAGDAHRHPRPWFPAFGGMTTFDEPGISPEHNSRRNWRYLGSPARLVTISNAHCGPR